MSRKQPSSEQIQAMLREGHFGESRALPAADPLTTTQMFLEIARINPYDHNPRKERNPLYDEIKESIRAQGGLNNPLTITRRPGEERFTVESGGNTRLQILHELWEETHDDRFYRIHCLFRPWISESHVLTAHLIENDKRGALTFIDKALGVRELRELLQAERREALTQRRLEEALRERGYALDQSTISRMDYAVDVLLPLIPETLRAGMGSPQVRRLRRLENACQELWNDRGQSPDVFAALFGDVLAAHDGADWELDTAQRALESRLAERLTLSLKEVRLEIDARLARGGEERNAPTPTDESTPTSPKLLATQVTSDTTTTADESRNAKHEDSTSSDGPHSNGRSPDESSAAMPTPATHPPHDTPPAPASPLPYDRPGDVKSLRSRGYVLALKIAKHHDLEDCLYPAGTLGMGFLVDIPSDAIIPIAGREDAVPQLFRQWLWWLLLSLSEEVVHPERMALAPDELLLRNLILEHNDAKALALVGEPDWKALGHELINNPSVPAETIDDLLALMLTCRRIRQLADDADVSQLWRRDG